MLYYKGDSKISFRRLRARPHAVRDGVVVVVLVVLVPPPPFVAPSPVSPLVKSRAAETKGF